MTSRTWLRTLFARTPRTVRKAPAHYRPRLEALEDRSLPSAAVWQVNAAATGSNTGQSWSNAYTDLQSALSAAHSGDQIWVAEGTYKPTSGTDRTISFALDAGVEVYGGFSGAETQLSQRNWGQHVTTLSGDIGTAGDTSDNSYHVVTSNALDNTAVLDGFTITGGNANGSVFPQIGFGTSPQRVGGGLFNFKSSPTVTNVTFSGNAATDGGGGMCNSISSPTLTNVTFSSNSAGSGFGGGMFNEYLSLPTLTNVIFTSNFAGSGGGMLNYKCISPTLTNVTFSSNSATFSGGGMYNAASSPTLTNCIVWGNTATTGGAQIKDLSGNTTVSYSDVQGGWSGTGTGDINADPLFVDAAHGNLHLQAGSPAIDVGTNTGTPIFDLDGNPRPVDSTSSDHAITDMGAYEFQHVATTTAVTSTGLNATYSTASDPVTLTATVTPANTLPGAVNEGTVTFTVLDDSQNTIATLSGNAVANGGASAPYDLEGLAAGSYTVHAAYVPAATDAKFIASADSSDGTLTIAARPITITPDANQSKVYGVAVAELTYTASGFDSTADAALLTGSLGTNATASSPVGSYDFTRGSLSAGSNYAVGLATNAPTFAVTPAKLTITASNASKIAGEANPTFTVSYNGFVLGEGPDVLGGTLTFTTLATTSSGPGTYAVTPGGLTSGNYDIKFVPGTLTVVGFSQATTNLQATVDAAGLDHGLQNALDSKLQAAIDSFDRGDTKAGVNQLGAFIDQVSAQRGKKIDAALADAFIAEAQRIITDARLIALSYGQATTNLQAQVDAAGLDHGLQNALDSKLQAAIDSFDRGDTKAGIDQLGAFIKQVSAQRGKKIDAALADAFIAYAQRIISAGG